MQVCRVSMPIEIAAADRTVIEAWEGGSAIVRQLIEQSARENAASERKQWPIELKIGMPLLLIVFCLILFLI